MMEGKTMGQESELKSGRSGRSPVPETSSTMLRELAAGADSARWTEFVDIYTPVLVYWLNCLRAGLLPSLSPDMYDDIIQETMVSMMKLFPKQGYYDKSRARFRTLLWTILRLRAIDCLVDSDRDLLRSTTGEELDWMQSEGMLLTSEDRPEDESRRKLRSDLWRLIVERVFAESNFSGRSKAIFMRHAAGESLSALAAEFGMEPNAVYQVKSRIMAKLTERARALERECGDILDMVRALEHKKGEAGNEK